MGKRLKLVFLEVGDESALMLLQNKLGHKCSDSLQVKQLDDVNLVS